MGIDLPSSAGELPASDHRSGVERRESYGAVQLTKGMMTQRGPMRSATAERSCAAGNVVALEYRPCGDEAVKPGGTLDEGKPSK